MSLLFVTCPATRKPVSTGIETHMGTLKKTWNSQMCVTCPHCSEVHEYKVRDAFLPSNQSDHLKVPSMFVDG
jgi:hypothetical protein